MSCTTTSTTQSIPDWAAGIEDLGQLYNDDTGLMQPHQVHISVVKPTQQHPLASWHISVYQLGGNGHVRNAWAPENCVARVYFNPAGRGRGISGRWNDVKRIKVSFMPRWRDWRAQGWNYFFSLYPEYKRPVRVTFNDNDFPPLSASASSSSDSASSTSTTASSTTSSTSSTSSSASSSSSSTATKSASSK